MPEMVTYSSFVDGLRVREHDGRSVRFLCQQRGFLEWRDRMAEIRREMKTDLSEEQLTVCLTDCKGRFQRACNRLADQVPGLKLRVAASLERLISSYGRQLRCLSAYELQMLRATGPWPNAGGEEVLPIYDMNKLASQRQLDPPFVASRTGA